MDEGDSHLVASSELKQGLRLKIPATKCALNGCARPASCTNCTNCTSLVSKCQCGRCVMTALFKPPNAVWLESKLGVLVNKSDGHFEQ